MSESSRTHRFPIRGWGEQLNRCIVRSRVKYLLILYCCLCIAFDIRLIADEYTIRGSVVSTPYDINGTPRIGELAPGLPASNACDYVWYRKGGKWRLDIEEPIAPFTQGVWKSVMPFAEYNLISIMSCPAVDSQTEGNAIVKVMTNAFLTAENIYGAHAVWLSHNLDQIVAQIGPSKKCPPFWDTDPAIANLRTNSHEIREKDRSILFWNLGHYFARDNNREVVFEAGEPKLLPYPLLTDTGFMEAELRFSVGLRDGVRKIPEYSELSYWVPLKDPVKPNGVRMVMISKLAVTNSSVDVGPIADSVFVPSWTNTIATVFDFREKAVNNQPLIYITKAKTISANLEDLIKHKKFDEKVRAAAQTSTHSSESSFPLLPRVLLVFALLSLPAGLWFIFKRRENRPRAL